MVQIHDNFEKALRLLEWIHHPDNCYLVMVDCSKAVPEPFQAKAASYGNVHVFNDMPGVWGGASLVAATIEAMRRALALPQAWTSFINLSGSDVPLMSQEAIMAALAEHRGRGQTTFVADFGGAPFLPRIAVDKTVADCRLVPFRSDLEFRVFGQAQSLFVAGGSPITRPPERISVHVYEDLARKALHVRPLYHEEQRARAAFFAEHPFHFGRQWIIADRRVAEFVCAAPLAALFFDMLKSVLIPDECYFQMLFGSPAAKLEQVVSSNNFRYFYGEPVHLTDKDFDALLASNAFFARKLGADADCARIIENARTNSHRPPDAGSTPP